MRSVSVGALAALVLTPASAMAEAVIQVTPSADAPVISVSATEYVDATPDLAIVGAGVSSLAPTAVAALQANSAKMTRLVAAVRAAGVAERDLQTRGIAINAEYSYVNNTQQFRGYRASNSVTIRTRDIGGLGRFLDALVTAGGNQIDGPSFTIEKPAPLLIQARAKAVASAQASADALAQAAGYTRARLLTISESGGRSAIMLRERTMAITVQASAPSPVSAPPVAPGEVSAGVTLTGTYRLER